jgi:signal transduction histidine kinase
MLAPRAHTCAAPNAGDRDAASSAREFSQRMPNRLGVTIDSAMSSSPRRVAPRLAAVLVAGLAVQGLLWLRVQPLDDRFSFMTLLAFAAALFVTAFCLGIAGIQLRRALHPLRAHAAHLRALAAAQAPEKVRKSKPPPLAALDPALRDVVQLRQRLLARLEQSQRLLAQAEQATAYKTEFLRSVRHELRTPLNAVLGFAEVLLAGIEGPLTASQRENLAVIARTGKRLQDLFDEVIELAAVVAGQFDLQRDAVDATALLEHVCELLEDERGDRPVHIRVDVPDGAPVAAGDPFRLEHMLRGMASHALSVCTGHMLVLSAAPSHDGVHLCVRDPSRVLSSAEIDVLLARQPIGSRRKGLDESSRLRIVIWQQLAQLYGGQFSVHSDQHGGTTYALELPSWRQP